jgi:hypothetical protein
LVNTRTGSLANMRSSANSFCDSASGAPRNRALGRGVWLWAATPRLRMQLACTAWLPLQNSLSVGPLRAGPCPGPSASILPKLGTGARRSPRRGRRRPRTSLAMMSRRSRRRARRGALPTRASRMLAIRASPRWRARAHEAEAVHAGVSDFAGGSAQAPEQPACVSCLQDGSPDGPAQVRSVPRARRLSGKREEHHAAPPRT